MSRHLIPADEVEIAANGVALPKRKHIRFAGGASVADDNINGRTVVTGESAVSGGFVGSVRYDKSSYAVTAGGNYDCGTQGFSWGDISWLRNDSNFATGLIVFGAPGLYTVYVNASVADAATENQIGVLADVYFGDQLGTNLNRNYSVERGALKVRTISGTVYRAASFTITDYFDDGGVIDLYWVNSSAFTGVNAYSDLIITKVI